MRAEWYKGQLIEPWSDTIVRLAGKGPIGVKVAKDGITYTLVSIGGWEATGTNRYGNEENYIVVYVPNQPTENTTNIGRIV